MTALARVAFFALLALIIFGVVLIFVHVPQGTLIYAVLGLVIFAVLTMFDLASSRRVRATLGESTKVRQPRESVHEHSCDGANDGEQRRMVFRLRGKG